MGTSTSRPSSSVCITPHLPYYTLDIAAETTGNRAYRHVIYTATNLQLVLMSIPPGGDIPAERHPRTDQFIRIEAGDGEAEIEGRTYTLRDDAALIIPAGAQHRIVNSSDSAALKLYTLYSPPEHAAGTVELESAASSA